jgi:hypothetical protein
MTVPTTDELIDLIKTQLAACIVAEQIDVKVGSIEVKQSQKTAQLLATLANLEQRKAADVEIITFEDTVSSSGGHIGGDL